MTTKTDYVDNPGQKLPRRHTRFPNSPTGLPSFCADVPNSTAGLPNSQNGLPGSGRYGGPKSRGSAEASEPAAGFRGGRGRNWGNRHATSPKAGETGTKPARSPEVSANTSRLRVLIGPLHARDDVVELVDGEAGFVDVLGPIARPPDHVGRDRDGEQLEDPRDDE